MKENRIIRIFGARLALHGRVAGTLLTLFCGSAFGQPILNLSTRYAAVQIDDKGFVVSLTARQSGKEYSPAGHPSPLMSLHENGEPYSQLMAPASAIYNRESKLIELKYPNGAVAIVKPVAMPAYLRFQLISLTPRGNVDNIVWGPLNTTIAGRIGDLIGVVRSDDWAIGMIGLDDNTIAGPPDESDCYQMGYFIHSTDPVKHPVPPQLHEGQRFNVGGDGVNDTAFSSHAEEYFQYIVGNGARIEPDFGSSIAYHSRDRRRPYTYLFTLIPGFHDYRARHQVSDPLPGVDVIGSAVALYACPDNLGLPTIESIILAEGLPHPMFDGKWIRDPREHQPDLFWNGPVDKEIEYAEAMGLKHLSRETGECFVNRAGEWTGSVHFADGHTMSYKDFGAEAAKHGMGHGGLHTLTMFLQGGINNDVTPVPSEHLQTVCRTTLAKDISATDKQIEVTDPTFLAEKGTWPRGDASNYIRVGGEMMAYSTVTDKPPYIVTVTERGHASQAAPHKAGDELAKLQQNCYNGFAPDMTLVKTYAEYYAKLMADNNMEAIGFDGLESTLYQNQGYYGVRYFFRNLFETYAKLTGGKSLRMLPSCIFPGGWMYEDAANIAGGDRMFDPVANRWGTQGKDFRNALRNSYYPCTFGLRGYNPSWCIYDVENLEAKSVGWDCTYAFVVSQAAVDESGIKDDFFKAFHAWEAARAAGAFTPAQLTELQDTSLKYHLEQTGSNSFTLYPIKVISLGDSAGNVAKTETISNANEGQPLQFAIRMAGPVDGCTVTLPNGSQINANAKIDGSQYIICNGHEAYIADKFRKKIAPLQMNSTDAILPAGDSRIDVQFPVQGNARAGFGLDVWISGKGERVGS